MKLSRLFATTLFTIWLAVTLAFFALRLLPGDAISAQLADANASPKEIAARRAALSLDAPLLQQYASYLAGLARGKLGVSLLDGSPVQDLLAPRLGPSAYLAFSAIILAVVLGIPIGTLSASPRAGVWCKLARICASLSLAIPVYWTATLALLLTATGSQSAWLRSWLPVVVLGFGGMGSIARLVASEVRAALGADFARVAQAKGLSPAHILFEHVTRVALLPTVSVIAVQFGWLMGGAVMTEVIFNRPGLGRLLLDRTINQDYPVVQGIVIFSTLVFVVVNAAAELCYRLLDPRIRATT